MNYKKFLFIPAFALFFIGCKDNDPVKEDVPELITKVTLTFSSGSGEPIVVTATDPDGEGIQSIKTDGAIRLLKGVNYTLNIELVNGLADPSSDAYNVTNEVESEGIEHMFFFAWTKDAFAAPTGNGNIDNRNDPVDYSESVDAKGLPLGLKTKWTASDVAVDGATFRVVLKHQPDLKSATSTSSDGETDVDLTFDLSVQ